MLISLFIQLGKFAKLLEWDCNGVYVCTEKYKLLGIRYFSRNRQTSVSDPFNFDMDPDPDPAPNPT